MSFSKVRVSLKQKRLRGRYRNMIFKEFIETPGCFLSCLLSSFLFAVATFIFWSSMLAHWGLTPDCVIHTLVNLICSAEHFYFHIFANWCFCFDRLRFWLKAIVHSEHSALSPGIWLKISVIVCSPWVVLQPTSFIGLDGSGCCPQGHTVHLLQLNHTLHNVKGMFQFLMFTFLEIFLKQRKTTLESSFQRFHWPSQQNAIDLMPLNDHNLYIT